MTYSNNLKHQHPILLFLKLCIADEELKNNFCSNPLSTLEKYNLTGANDSALKLFNMFPFVRDFPDEPANIQKTESWLSYISYLRGVTFNSFQFEYFSNLLQEDKFVPRDKMSFHEWDCFQQNVIETIRSNLSSIQSHGNRKRCFHLISVSLAKSGSTSLSGLFSSYCAIHEGLHEETVTKILDYKDNKINANELDSFLLTRDKALKPEMDSGTFFHLVADRLPNLFPEAKFVCTIRDVSSWITSSVARLQRIANGNKQTNEPQEWYQRYAQVVFPNTFDWWNIMQNDTASLCFLEPFIENFAQVWHDSIIHVLRSIPPEKIFIHNIKDLSDAKKMRIFSKQLNIPFETLNINHSHLNKEDTKKLNNVGIQVGENLIKKISEPWQKKIDKELEVSGIISSSFGH